MTKQLSLCNQLQTAFESDAHVPSCETIEESVSRHWELLPCKMSRNKLTSVRSLLLRAKPRNQRRQNDKVTKQCKSDRQRSHRGKDMMVS